MGKKVIMPLQPIRDGRFVPNRIVDKLLETSPIGLNEIAVMDFTEQERIQFAQLIGYSLSGFSDLSYVDDETYEAAETTAEGINEHEARAKVLRDRLESVMENVRDSACALFRVHPDDLQP